MERQEVEKGCWIDVQFVKQAAEQVYWGSETDIVNDDA